MWFNPQSIITWQRQAALQTMGEQARELQREGYAVDADRVLDALIERRLEWQTDKPA